MRYILLLCAIFGLVSCSKPIDSLKKTPTIALVALKYDTNIYRFSPDLGVEEKVYARFSGKHSQYVMHETILNEFIVEFMRRTKEVSNISIVRPLKLLNTTLLQDTNGIINYEFLLDPYDPIDISNQIFMAGLADRLNVDAVADIKIFYAVHLDELTLWEEYNDPYAETLVSYRRQLKDGHDTSELRTTIRITVVDRYANQLFDEIRFVDTHSDQIVINDRDLSFDGGVSPKLLQKGLSDWLQDWVDYLPKYNFKDSNYTSSLPR